jgi:hypothetical protein
MGIEAALLGSAAAGSTAATAGLIGSGGGLFGISALTGSTIFSGLSAASSLFGGASANREAQRQAVTAQAEANLRAEETARAGVREASFVGMEAESVRRRQKLAYLKSGVDLEGSPLLMMEATRQAGLENVDQVLRSSGSTAGAQIQEGRARATQLKSSGRQAFMSGIGNAAGSLARVM